MANVVRSLYNKIKFIDKSQKGYIISCHKLMVFVAPDSICVCTMPNYVHTISKQIGHDFLQILL